MKEQPYEGDHYIGLQIRSILDELPMIQAIIETGTEFGATAIALSKFHKPVITIEHNIETFALTKNEVIGHGVSPICGSSPKILPSIFHLLSGKPTFLYLDAHDHKGTVIRDELKAVGNFAYPIPVIAIHDIKNPEHPEFGYDVYEDGTELTWDYIKDYVTWPHEKIYNHIAAGAKRGVLYLFPKEQNENEELSEIAAEPEWEVYRPCDRNRDLQELTVGGES